MKILIEEDIKNCTQCPFAEHYTEFGFSGDICTKLSPYTTIPLTGIRKDCPFINSNNKK